MDELTNASLGRGVRLRLDLVELLRGRFGECELLDVVTILPHPRTSVNLGVPTRTIQTYPDLSVAANFIYTVLFGER